MPLKTYEPEAQPKGTFLSLYENIGQEGKASISYRDLDYHTCQNNVKNLTVVLNN